MSLAALVVELSANTAKFQSDMGKAVHMAERGAYAIKSAFASLGVGIGAGFFLNLIKGSIDSADQLQDLTRKTGIAVEELSGFAVLAKQSGSDLEHLAKGIGMMSAEIGKSPGKFVALGVTAKDNLGALKQLADILNMLPQQQRDAVAAATFGMKHWQMMMPVITEGSTRIGELIEKGSKLSSVTTEMAQEADKFNDKLTELTATGGFFTRLIGPILPLLNSLAEDLSNARDKTEGLNSSFKPLAETLKPLIILGANVSFVFQQVGKDMARAAENVQLIAKLDFAGSRALGEMFRKDAAAARQALDDYEKKIMGLGLTGAPRAPGVGADPAAAAAAAARAAAFLGDGKAKAAAEKEAAMRKRFREMDNAGWVKHIDAMTQEYEDGLREMAKMDEVARTASEKGRAEGMQAYFKIIDDQEAAAIEAGEAILAASKKDTDEMTEFWKAAAQNMQQAMSGFFFDVMQGQLGDLAGSFKRTIDRMVADVLAAKAATALFGKDFGKDGVSIGGLVGKAAGWLGGMFGGGGGSLLDSAGNTGLGFSGYATGTDFVPRTGLAVVHQGEAIIPAAENVNGGRGIMINMNVNTPDANSFRASRGQIIADMSMALAGARRNL